MEKIKNVLAFTLIELLVVIGVISILASMLLPALGKTKETVLRSTCLSNMRQYAVCLQQYAEDNNEWGPKVPSFNQEEALEISIMDWLPKPANESIDIDGKARVLITICPATQMNASGKRPGWTGAVSWAKYIITGFSNAFGWVGDGDGTWYGFTKRNVSIYGQTPRLTMLGKGEQTFGSVKRTIMRPTVQPLCGDRFVINAVDNSTGGTLWGSANGWKLNHRALGTNALYFDGHGKWFDLPLMRERKIAKAVPFYSDKCVPLDL